MHISYSATKQYLFFLYNFSRKKCFSILTFEKKRFSMCTMCCEMGLII